MEMQEQQKVMQYDRNHPGQGLPWRGCCIGVHQKAALQVGQKVANLEGCSHGDAQLLQHCTVCTELAKP